MDRIMESTGRLVAFIDSKYPGLDITQLGMSILVLGGLKSILGHDNAMLTCRDYSHVLVEKDVDPQVSLCMEFIEREVFGLTKSRLDIDVYKTGRRTRRKFDKKYTEEEQCR